MSKCPICENHMKNQYHCGTCGYDASKDFVESRTLMSVKPEDAEDYLNWRSKEEKQQVQDKQQTPVKRKRFSKWGIFLIIITILRFIISNLNYSVAETVNSISLYAFCGIVMIILPISILIFIVRTIRKKTVKTLLKFIGVCLILAIIFVVFGRASNEVIEYYNFISRNERLSGMLFVI